LLEGEKMAPLPFHVLFGHPWVTRHDRCHLGA
jgi:hypothetical protein